MEQRRMRDKVVMLSKDVCRTKTYAGQRRMPDKDVMRNKVVMLSKAKHLK